MQTHLLMDVRSVRFVLSAVWTPTILARGTSCHNMVTSLAPKSDYHTDYILYYIRLRLKTCA